tara:strand:+ start:10470 stop:11444 length:975 start_codon:yes stop_codon:yes gene_type:complete
MAEFPEFTQGQYGKLTTEHLNALTRQVRENTALIQQAGFGVSTQPRGGAGNFPIIARLGSRVDVDDEEGSRKPLRGQTSDDDGVQRDDGGESEGGPTRPGYDWVEVIPFVTGSNLEFNSADRRRYDGTNPAMPTKKLVGAGALGDRDQRDELGNVNEFTGKIVLLFPSATQDGKAALIFQGPFGNDTITAVIKSGEEGSSCDPAGGGFYTVQRFNSDGVFGPTFFARNGAERNGVGMGGSIDNVECELEAPPVKIPVGKAVLCNQDGDGAWWFTATNERCVSCCEATEGFSDEIETLNTTSTVRAIAVPNFEQGVGSIVREMMS